LLTSAVMMIARTPAKTKDDSDDDDHRVAPSAAPQEPCQARREADRLAVRIIPREEGRTHDLPFF